MDYRLGNYLVREEGDSIRWGTWADLDGRGLDSFSGGGRVVAQKNLLVLSTWKVRSESSFADREALERALEGLPRWSKTRYYVKLVDFGEVPVMVCKTNTPAPDKVQESMLRWWRRAFLGRPKARSGRA